MKKTVKFVSWITECNVNQDIPGAKVNHKASWYGILEYIYYDVYKKKGSKEISFRDKTGKLKLSGNISNWFLPIVLRFGFEKYSRFMFACKLFKEVLKTKISK